MIKIDHDGGSGHERLRQNADASSRASEISIYVVKNVISNAGEADRVSFSVGVNGRTHLVDAGRAETLANLGEILDSMD